MAADILSLPSLFPVHCGMLTLYTQSGGLLNLPMGPGPVILSPQEDVPLMVEDEQQHQPIAAEKPAAGEFCTICEFAISKVEQELQANATEAEIIATVEKICDILPATVKDQCKTLIESEGPQIINLLISKANPETICTAIGLCTNASLVVPVVESVAPVNAPEAGPLCTICEFVISKVEAELGNNSTEAQIIAAIEKVCSILPKTVASECKQLIDQLGPEIINLLINKAAPEVICTAIHACTGSKLPRVQQGVSDKPYCQVCEQVMTYVQSLLKQNSTVEEVEQLIDNICDYLPGSYQNQCKDLVDQYAPQIIAQLAEKVNPDQICAEIQLCTDLPQEVMPVRQVV